MVKAPRLIRHIFSSKRHVAKAFSEEALSRVEAAIQTAEAAHHAELRVVIEARLDGYDVLNQMTSRQRAIELFSTLRVWDTEHNSGVLVYVLMADRAIEIVADRGIVQRAPDHTWETICKHMQAAFAAGQFEQGLIDGIQAIADTVHRHIPAGAEPSHNELPDKPLML